MSRALAENLPNAWTNTVRGESPRFIPMRKPMFRGNAEEFQRAVFRTELIPSRVGPIHYILQELESSALLDSGRRE
ncbi:hypothetical protein J6590_003106 [Homalodisca vitripennis]|nr:hypothetical protein J6590_003106 [Homalodisca vitripennis]